MTPTVHACLFLLLITLCYAALCAVSPFGTCRRCGGLGFKLLHNRRGKPRRGKTCRRCRGHGRRIRVGRRIANAWMRIHRDGTR